MAEPTDADIIDDFKRVGSLLQLPLGADFGRNEYLTHTDAKFTGYQMYDGGGRGWEKLCIGAGYKPKTKPPKSDDVYFENLVLAMRDIKAKPNGESRYPKSTERKKYGLNFSKGRYATLPIFIERAIELGWVEDLRPKAAKHEPASLVIRESPVSTIPSRKSDGPRETPPIPKRSKWKKWERIDVKGFPYAPHDESGTVALFCVLCAQGALNWDILQLNGGKGIDSICWDHETQREIRVELKYKHSKANWNHPLDEIDCVVCWVNSLKDFPKPVIELRSLLMRRGGADTANN